MTHIDDRPCPGCGAPTGTGQRFCPECGRQLARVDEGTHPRHIQQYTLEAEIGRGGMGVVYRARDERLGRPVAFKLLRNELSDDPSFRRRFEQESRSAAGLDHPGVLPVFEAGEADGRLFIVTRLVDGPDLARAVAEEGPMEPDRALAVCREIAGALDHAHARGLVHRDVKPQNVLLRRRRGTGGEQAYLIDFGIGQRVDAREGGDLTAAGHVVGTPAYAAPEQLRGGAVDARADQWSLARVLRFCLMGCAPDHDGGAPTGHPAIDAALQRALQQRPADRFATCGAFIEAASRGSDETVVDQLASIPAAPEEPRPAKRSKLLLAGGGVVVAAVAGAAAFLLSRGGGDEDRPAPGRVAAVTVPARASAPRTVVQAAAVPSTTTTTAAATEPVAAEAARPVVIQPLDVARLDLERQSLSGYSASLPSTWKTSLDDAEQAPPGPVSRRRTTLTDAGRGVSVSIDHLRGFDQRAEQNRTTLQRTYAATRPDYSYVDEADLDLDGTKAYEWRYRVDNDAGHPVQRVDVMTDRGGDLYAVLASGRSSFDDLAALARKVAGSIEVADDDGGAGTPEGSSRRAGSQVPARDPRTPDAGTYTGEGTQHVGSVDNPGVQLRLTIGARSSMEYSGLGCVARLTPTGFDGQARVYRERFTTGSCDDPGTWRVQRQDDGVFARWSSKDGAYTLTAQLDG